MGICGIFLLFSNLSAGVWHACHYPDFFCLGVFDVVDNYYVRVNLSSIAENKVALSLY